MTLTDAAPPKTLWWRAAKGTAPGFPTYDLRVIRFIKGQFGRYDNKADGYSLRVTYDNFPGMNVRYVEGPRTMNLFGELMANLKDLHLDLNTVGHWDEPYGSETIDEAHLTLVLERIVSGLGHMRYAVKPIGHARLGGRTRPVTRATKRSAIRRPRRDARHPRESGQ